MSRWLAAVAGGTAIYLAVVGSLAPWAAVQGALAAAGAYALARTRSTDERPEGRRSWRALVPVAAATACDIFRGSWTVGSAAAGVRPVPRPEWVEVSVGEHPPVRPETLALLETMSPGSYLVDFDEERRVLLFHVFDHAEAEALRRRHARALAEEAAEAEAAPGDGTEGDGP